jgi:hypothetical protein
VSQDDYESTIININNKLASLMLTTERITNLTLDNIRDLVKQVYLMKRELPTLRKKFENQIVAYCGNQLFYGKTFQEVRKKIRKEFPDRLYYAKSLKLTTNYQEGKL